MYDDNKRKQIEFQIQKLQTLLTKIIADSKEMQEIKKLMHADDMDMQLCIFSLMVDKESAEVFREMDMEMLQKMILEAHSQKMKSHEESEPENSWTDEDISFLKSLKIII